MLRLPIILSACLLPSALLTAQRAFGPEPLAHTYSIVAIDPATGDMGVAVQSHWFATGTLVIWGEAGTGVVATQSFVNPAFGPQGLQLLREGRSPREALDALLADDEGRDYRQVALLDAQGRKAAHTGKLCIEAAGHRTGPDYAVQANMMTDDTVWPAMAEAFTASAGAPLPERLLTALAAAEAAGGDIRGSQSAALLVVSAENTGRPWVDRKVDLRVDDHPDPIGELRRLLRTHRAYEHMNRGDLAMEAGNIEVALQEYSAAQTLFPDNLEMQYWQAVNLVNAGRLEEALPIFARIFQQGANWRELTPRLVPVGLLLVSEADLRKIMAAGL